MVEGNSGTERKREGGRKQEKNSISQLPINRPMAALLVILALALGLALALALALGLGLGLNLD